MFSLSHTGAVWGIIQQLTQFLKGAHDGGREARKNRIMHMAGTNSNKIVFTNIVLLIIK